MADFAETIATASAAEGSALWFVNADVQTNSATHHCQMLMLVVPST
jgi:hypothetical protein